MAGSSFIFGAFQYKERERVTMRAGNFSFGESRQRKSIQFHADKNDRIPKISFLHHRLAPASPTLRNHIFHVVPSLIMSAIVRSPVRAERSLSSPTGPGRISGPDPNYPVGNGIINNICVLKREPDTGIIFEYFIRNVIS